MASISIIIPTHDGQDLARCLTSVLAQTVQGDEVIVAWDSHDSSPGEGWDHFDHPHVMLFLHNAGYHAFGHPQRNIAMERATGDYLMHIDDDDELLPGALDAIRAAIDRYPGRPLMFRFISPYGVTVPRVPGLAAEANVGGTGFVTPNDLARLGRWSDRYEGDYDYITSTLATYPPDALWWGEFVVARCSDGAPRLWFHPVRQSWEAEIMRGFRNASREWMTGDTREITPQEQERWLAARDPDKVQAWLTGHGNTAFGYGLLTWRQGRWWASLAVSPHQRGRGIGTALYRHLIAACPDDDLWIAVKETNAASLAAARRAGFGDEMSLRDGTLTLVARKKVMALA